MTNEQYNEARQLWDELSAVQHAALRAHNISLATRAMGLDQRLRRAIVGERPPGRVAFLRFTDEADEELAALLADLRAFLAEPEPTRSGTRRPSTSG